MKTLRDMRRNNTYIFYETALAVAQSNTQDELIQNSLESLVKLTGYNGGLAIAPKGRENSQHGRDKSWEVVATCGEDSLRSLSGKAIGILGSEKPMIPQSTLQDLFPELKWAAQMVCLEFAKSAFFLLLNREKPSSEEKSWAKSFVSDFEIFGASLEEAVRPTANRDPEISIAGNVAPFIEELTLFSSAFDSIPDPVIIFEEDGLRLVRANMAAWGTWGGRRGDPIDKLTGISQKEWKKLREELSADINSIKSNFTIKKIAGQKGQYSVSLGRIKRGRRQLLTAWFRNIGEEVRIEGELLREKKRAELTLGSIGDGVITTDEKGRIDFMNTAAENLCGWKLDEVLGEQCDKVITLCKSDDGKILKRLVNQCIKIKSQVDMSEERIVMKDRNEKSFDVEYTVSPLFEGPGKLMGTVSVIRDVSKSRRLEDRLIWQARHDPLTGLYNRREFEEELTSILDLAVSKKVTGVMLYFDLDQFKLVNDICGHIAGDELLKQLTSIIKLNLSPEVHLARLGGDEFGAILVDRTIEDAKPVAGRIIEAVHSYRFQWGKSEYKVGVSIGIVPIHHESVSLTHVMSMADIACDTAKELGRNRYHIYIGGELEFHKKRGQMEWVSRIKTALEDENFILYIMPIVPVKDTSEDGSHFEVLLRMRDDSGNIVYPQDFISAAEKYNMMQAIDKWVIEHTFRALSQKKMSYLHKAGDPIYSINLSGSSLADTSFSVFVLDCFQEFNINPQKVCFEITESEAINNFNIAQRFIGEMKSVGCSFALDDFGTGLSSFSYLKTLPVDWLKIDGCFVKDIMEDPIDLAMLESINEIGHIMNMKTVAEYVESEIILDKIREVGIDYAQGYAIQKPYPIGSLP